MGCRRRSVMLSLVFVSDWKRRSGEEDKADREKYVTAARGYDSSSPRPSNLLYVRLPLHNNHLIKASLRTASRNPMQIGWTRTERPFRDQSSILRCSTWGKTPQLRPSKSDPHKVWGDRKRIAKPVMAAHISCSRRSDSTRAIRPTTSLTRFPFQCTAMQSVTSKHPR
jgi:hypothetical protein